ncbi:MAG: N-acetylmuramoyl-L-alanine amidase [Myxococcales bacterium]|nr:N-acetylmuramoyl-L-alanine amidase [Myxococcales bacterium]
MAAAPGLTHVVLDPGHGGPHDGAPARFAPGRWEKEYALDIAEQVAARLRAQGVEVSLTRTDNDTDVGLRERVNIANRRRADLFVSIHLNSTERPGPVGHESFFLALKATDDAAERLAAFENAEGGVVDAHAAGEVTGDTASAILRDLTWTRAHHDSQRLAAAIQARVTPLSPFPNRGVKQADFAVLKGAAMPAVVFEGGFLNHRKEGRWLTTPEARTLLAQGVAEGILDFGREVLARRAARPQPTLAPRGAPP